MEQQELLSTTGETVEYAKIYLEQQFDYARLETTKRIALTTSEIVTAAVIAFLAFMVLLFLSVSIGFFLGVLWGSYALSFLFLTGVYAASAILVYFFRKDIISNPITSLIIKNLLD